MRIEIEREEDGRWIGEVPALPGVFAYGATPGEAYTNALVLALRVVANRLEHGEYWSEGELYNLFIADCQIGG